MVGRMQTKTYEVDPGDPHNDQLTMQVSDDLRENLDIVSHVLDQAEHQDAPLSSVVAALAQNFIDQEEVLPRERLASLLAMALIQLCAHEYVRNAAETTQFINKLRDIDEF